MKGQTAKEYLQNIRSLRLEIDYWREQLEEKRASLLPSGIRYDKVVVQTSPTDSLVEAMGEIEELEKRMGENLRRLVGQYDKALACISKLEKSDHRLVLSMYYLSSDRPRWEDVAVRMNYSERKIYHLHEEAIEELEKIWSN